MLIFGNIPANAGGARGKARETSITKPVMRFRFMRQSSFLARLNYYNTTPTIGT